MAEPFDPDRAAHGDRRPGPRRTPRGRRLLSILVLFALALSIGSGSWEHWRTEYAKWRNDADAYAFLHLRTDGTGPVTYSSCHPIEVLVNPRTMPAGAAGLLEEAVAEIADASGLEMRVTGTTTTSPDAWVPTWSTVTVWWSDAAETPRLDGAAGLGGSTTRFVGFDGQLEVYASGRVWLNGPSLRGSLDGRSGRDRVRAVIAHELGHVLGLDHVDDRGQLMYGDGVRVDDLRAGDRTGLARLGQGPCTDLS